MSRERPTALIADDEPLLRDELAALLADTWPALAVVATARNGREAIALFDEHRPDVCFLDVQMPGLTGIDAARHVGARAHLVLVTAYDHYALQAFEHGVLDYLVKPVTAERLAASVGRLRARLAQAAPPLDADALLARLAAQLDARRPAASLPGEGGPLRWLRAQVGGHVRMIAIDDVDYLRSDEKYTLVAWRDEHGRPAEALIATPLKALLPQLDAARFAQVHRAVVVNLAAVRHVVREDEKGTLHLKGRAETLPVSRLYLGLFRHM